MKKKTMRIIVIILAAVMLLSILVPMLTVLAGASSTKVTEDDIKKIKGELSDISAQRAKAQAQLSAIRGDLSRAKEQISLIESQILLTEHEISISQRLLEQYDMSIQSKELELRALEDREAAQYAQFCNHVRWLEETGSVSYLSILFKASSFSELLDYAVLIADIMDYSNSIIDDLQETQAEIGVARDALQESRDEQAAVSAGLTEQKESLESLLVEAEDLYSEIAASEAEIASEAQALLKEEQAIQSELKKAEDQFAKQIAALQQNNGSWYWPLPGSYKLSSLFGGRLDPFTGRPSNHTGVDIPAVSGTKIYAAQAGVVTLVQTNRYATTYGYYCIISHGNGKSTLYAHMKSAPVVKEGQTVTKGQLIGYVGSTGRSTGPHLHFELRIDGVRADALTLYKGMTFTSPGGATIKGG